MRTAIAAAFALLIIGLVVGAYFQGRSDGFAAHETAAQQKALVVTKQSLATSERLRTEGNTAAAEDRARADATIATIRQREADAQAARDAHAARADMAESSADDAWALVDQLTAEATEPSPQLCDWLCVIPPLESPQ